jgi:hypothetical protein
MSILGVTYFLTFGTWYLVSIVSSLCNRNNLILICYTSKLKMGDWAKAW